jgi:hypothetical protein
MPKPKIKGIKCLASNPQQTITLYKDGSIRICVKGDSTAKTRTFTYRPKQKSERKAVKHLIHNLNLTAAGYIGRNC